MPSTIYQNTVIPKYYLGKQHLFPYTNIKLQHNILEKGAQFGYLKVYDLLYRTQCRFPNFRVSRLHHKNSEPGGQIKPKSRLSFHNRFSGQASLMSQGRTAIKKKKKGSSEHYYPKLKGIFCHVFTFPVRSQIT